MTRENNGAVAHVDIKPVMEKAAKGDLSVLPALRAYLDEHPGFWQSMGDMAHVTQTECINRMFGDDELMKACVTRSLDALVRELEGPTPSPLETILAQQVALDRLYLQKMEYQLDHPDRERTRSQREYDDRRVTKSHARHMKAIKTLAQVRKLLGPTVQVNIARQQVNVATGGVPSRS